MKVFLSLLLLACYSFDIHAQNFGISSTGALPNVSAGLDVDFTNKGVLIPRVALSSLTDAVTIPTPATSLLVYSQGGSITDGYYYNSGTSASPVWSSFITTASATMGCFTNWQLFTANGTFVIPAGITRIKVCVYGGGAGGNGYYSTTAGGGGGGGGGYAEGIYTVSPLASYTVTIGAGGSGSNGGAIANNGGTTSFGALVSASGGLAGGISGTFGFIGGVGGWGSGGYLNSSLGNGGGAGYSLSTPTNGTGGGGTGGTSINGNAGGGGGGGYGGGNGGSGLSSGIDAQPNSGGGGGGGGASSSLTGGNGAAGKVIVFW